MQYLQGREAFEIAMLPQVHFGLAASSEEPNEGVVAKLLSDTVSHRGVLSKMQGHEKTSVPHPRAHGAFESGLRPYDTTGRVLLGKRRHKHFFADALWEKTTFEKRVIFPRTVAMQPLFLRNMMTARVITTIHEIRAVDVV